MLRWAVVAMVGVVHMQYVISATVWRERQLHVLLTAC
jgi:hypothetical protein